VKHFRQLLTVAFSARQGGQHGLRLAQRNLAFHLHFVLRPWFLKPQNLLQNGEEKAAPAAGEG
jgi:hypothetical protein